MSSKSARRLRQGRDVAMTVLANKDIATRLFVSPRTVQTHLTHVHTTRPHRPHTTRPRGGSPHLTDIAWHAAQGQGERVLPWFVRNTVLVVQRRP